MGKHTVYMSAEQEERLKDSGLAIADVLERGLNAVPPSEDSKLPNHLTEAVRFLHSISGILLYGGQVLTPFASQEALEAAQAQGELKGLDDLLEDPSRGSRRSRPARTRKGSGSTVPAPQFSNGG
jgi:hypothetical protein